MGYISSDLRFILRSEGIQLERGKLPYPLEAMYCTIYELPVITISNEIPEWSPKFRCLLAEELGHHFTTIGAKFSQPHLRYRDRIIVTKTEYRAMRWAAEYLIPLDKLIRATRSGLYSIWELSEHFFVTEEMMRFRLNLPDLDERVS